MRHIRTGWKDMRHDNREEKVAELEEKMKIGWIRDSFPPPPLPPTPPPPPPPPPLHLLLPSTPHNMFSSHHLNTNDVIEGKKSYITSLLDHDAIRTFSLVLSSLPLPSSSLFSSPLSPHSNSSHFSSSSPFPLVSPSPAFISLPPLPILSPPRHANHLLPHLLLLLLPPPLLLLPPVHYLPSLPLVSLSCSTFLLHFPPSLPSSLPPSLSPPTLDR